MRKIFWVVFLSIIFSCNLSYCEEVKDGLGITITQVESTATQSLTPQFLISLQNVGQEDFVLNLGMMLGMGKKQYSTEIKLILSDYAGGNDRILELRGPTGIAGRLDDYIVPLQAGASYNIKITLSDYWCPETKEFELKLSKGKYILTADYIGKEAVHSKDMKLLYFWRGKVQSKSVEFKVEK